MSTQYRLVQSGKTASGGCSAGQGSVSAVAPRIYLLLPLFCPLDETTAFHTIFLKSTYNEAYDNK
jgi:hypothetical protein